MHEGVQGNGKDEQSAHGVANLQQGALQEARGFFSIEGVQIDPSQTDDKRQALQEIRYGQVIDQDDILVVPDVSTVILLPKHKPICDERYETKRTKQREQGQSRNHDQAISLQRW